VYLISPFRVALVMASCFLTNAAFGQTIGGAISGTVKDQQGSVMPGATARFTNVETGVTTAVLSNSSGSYRATNLQPGHYDLTISLPGFARGMQKNFTLTVGAELVIDFTLKVAEQMPEADYGFKLTPPQMSFAEQMVHLSEEQAGLLAPLTGTTPKESKPASMNKKDVIAFIRQSFDRSIATVSTLTPAQISKTYSGGEGTMTGLELLMFVLDHNTHHRASAEMYLRAKGITPPNPDKPILRNPTKSSDVLTVAGGAAGEVSITPMIGDAARSNHPW